MDAKLFLFSHFFDTTLLKKNCKIKCNETIRVDEKSVLRSKFVICAKYYLIDRTTYFQNKLVTAESDRFSVI